MRARLFAAAAAFAALAAQAQIAAPETWRRESFTFPLAFAPKIPYEGAEHVRFAPYWSQFATDRGFTYVFLWDIRRQAIEPQALELRLREYFDGLMESVTKARKIADPGTVTASALHPMAVPAGWEAALGGKLWTWNGFARGEPLLLNLEISHRPCGAERTQIFFALSQAPREHSVWEELRRIRGATPCSG